MALPMSGKGGGRQEYSVKDKIKWRANGANSAHVHEAG